MQAHNAAPTDLHCLVGPRSPWGSGTAPNNFGDSKSLVTHPATTTHMRIGEAERARLGITDGVIRFSVGLEDVDDLREDLAAALAAIGGRAAA